MLLKCLFGIIACTLPVATADFAVNSFSDGISDALLPRQFPGGVSLTDFTPCGVRVSTLSGELY